MTASDTKALESGDEKLDNEQTYDSALAAMVTKLDGYIVPLVNEAFGEKFSEKASVEIKNNKHIIQQIDGSLSRRETDAYVELSEATGQMVTRFYHIECETWYDQSIIVRIAEYASAIALDNAVVTKAGVTFNHPNSAVIFLRPDSGIPRVMKITHRAPNGTEMSYEVPAVQISDYTVDEIFGKRLLILLLFYLFRYVNEFEQMEDDAVRRKEMESVLVEINQRLEELAETGKITVYQKLTTQDLLMRVSDKLTIGFKEIRKGVDDIMSGYIARTRADDILEQGEQKGLEKGRKEGKKEGIRKGRREGQQETTRLMAFLAANGRSNDIVKAGNDEAFLNKLLAEFRNGAEAVEK